MNKKPTIKTIAEIAGVSHVTVSRALRGYSDISKATTERIRNIADELGYTPNAFARNLSLKKTNTIGMIVPALGNDTAYNDVFNAVSASAAKNGISVLLGSCNRDIELEKQFCHSMCENRVGALIVSPVSSEINHVKSICKNIVPVIFLGGKTGYEEEHCITIDYKHSTKTAVFHLYELGHRDIAFFYYAPENRTIEQKKTGYQSAMESLGLSSSIYMEGHSTNTLKAGTDLTEQLIRKHQLPSAIICASDLMAMGVLSSLKEHHIKVPKEVSIIGHDNLFFSDLSFISLTTFSLPKQEIGFKAVEMALALMNERVDEQQDLPNFKAFFQADLIERGSTGIYRSH